MARSIKELYTLDIIAGRMSLRKPQRESLENLEKILSCVELEKPDESGKL